MQYSHFLFLLLQVLRRTCCKRRNGKIRLMAFRNDMLQKRLAISVFPGTCTFYSFPNLRIENLHHFENLHHYENRHHFENLDLFEDLSHFENHHINLNSNPNIFPDIFSEHIRLGAHCPSDLGRSASPPRPSLYILRPS